MQQFYKNVVDSKVFEKKRSTCGVIKQLLREANPIFYPFVGAGGIVITPLLLRLKIPCTEIKSTCIATFCLIFYESWNFRILGRNGIARLSGMTAIYFNMILF